MKQEQMLYRRRPDLEYWDVGEFCRYAGFYPHSI